MLEKLTLLFPELLPFRTMTATEMQKRSAIKRWAGKTAEQKSAAMSKIRKAGIKNAKAKATITDPHGKA